MSGSTIPPRPPVVLIIRDGWGRNPHPEHAAFNAIELARTPVDAALTARWPGTLIRTCGEDVGLPAGTMGNSEVGHQNIGAGRVVDQTVMRITRAIRDGLFAKNEALRAAIAHARDGGGVLHLLGLMSDGQVHSDLSHCAAIIDLARREGLGADRLVVHAIMDGRDTSPRGGLGYIAQLESALAAAGVGRIATVVGRYWAMDRDHRWERTRRAYAALREGVPGAESVPVFPTAVDALRAWYDAPDAPEMRGDEFIPPRHIGAPAPVADGDSIIFFNFRGDRPRQITRAFVLGDDDWPAVRGGGFDRGPRVENLHFCTLAMYEEGLPVSGIAFPRPPRMEGLLGDIVSGAGLGQFRCAETEKFAHVTFFFNDYREEPFPGEARCLVQSPQDVTTYDQRPEMSAAGVAEAVLARVAAPDGEPLIVVNFANPDMVGHTGSLEATIRAVETVDAHVGRIVEAVIARGGTALVTADHGNAEQMFNPDTGERHTSHTIYDVPLIVAGPAVDGRRLRPGGRLGNIAPTILELLGLARPAAMTDTSLLEPVSAPV